MILKRILNSRRARVEGMAVIGAVQFGGGLSQVAQALIPVLSTTQ